MRWRKGKSTPREDRAGPDAAAAGGALQQVLWLETLLKLTGGLVLLIAPLTAIRVLGLPGTPSRFWPRLLGTVLVGLAIATFIEGWLPGSRGLSLAGCIAINLISAGTITTELILSSPRLVGRGRFILWLIVAILLSMSLVEVAYA